MNPAIAKGLIAVIPVLFSGCASYYTHYAMFPAQNSAGEDRQFKMTWQTADYPGWWIAEDKSTPITLSAQCSEREWRIVDRTHSGAAAESCAPGIRACGTKGMDVVATEGSTDFDERACIRVNPSDTDALVTELSSSLELLVNCRPAQTARKSGGETQNIDYLRASPVPYTVYSRKGPRGRLASKPPEFDDSVCDEE